MLCTEDCKKNNKIDCCCGCVVVHSHSVYIIQLSYYHYSDYCTVHVSQMQLSLTQLAAWYCGRGTIGRGFGIPDRSRGSSSALSYYIRVLCVYLQSRLDSDWHGMYLWVILKVTPSICNTAFSLLIQVTSVRTRWWRRQSFTVSGRCSNVLQSCIRA